MAGGACPGEDQGPDVTTVTYLAPRLYQAGAYAQIRP
jgi:hypothetical protein